jgi:DNA sulfur modification protein DndC
MAPNPEPCLLAALDATSQRSPLAERCDPLIHDTSDGMKGLMKVPSPGTMESISICKKQIRDEYVQPHSHPWIIGFSGGKDSTIVTQLVAEVILDLPKEMRTRKIFILYNDTKVESPVFQEYVTKRLNQIDEGLKALDVPISVITTTPPPDESFWFNLLGKGYPAPNRSFRWCMDRLKIEPTSGFIKEKVKEAGMAILLLGVRKTESISRAQRIEKYSAAADYARLVPNSEIPGCVIFRPVMDLTTEMVWDYIRNSSPPWGSGNLSLLELYSDAGMCNATQTCALIDEQQVADSKSILARFGCWTCTVVRKDRSLESLVDNGHKDLAPLVRFRERIRLVSDTPDCRSKTRRNGQPGLGPLTLEARKMLLSELLQIQAECGRNLITDHEIRLIREQWQKDETDRQIRELRTRFAPTIGDNA